MECGDDNFDRVRKSRAICKDTWEKDTTGMESDGYSKVEHKNMDLHNNAVERVLGSENLNAAEDEMADIIYNNICQKEIHFIWLHEWLECMTDKWIH